MEYFAGLDISMEETHVCVLDREGAVVHEARTISTAEAIFASLAKAPSCRRVVFETGRHKGLFSWSSPYRHGIAGRNSPASYALPCPPAGKKGLRSRSSPARPATQFDSRKAWPSPISMKRGVHRVADQGVWPGADQFVLLANLQRDRPIPAKFLVGPAKNPQRGAEDDRPERDRPHSWPDSRPPRGCRWRHRSRAGSPGQREPSKPDGFGRRAAVGYNPHALGPALERIPDHVPGDDAEHPYDLAD